MAKEHFVPKAPKEVAKLFKAKKPVSKSDAKKLANLVPFELSKQHKARVSDNKVIAVEFFVLGSVFTVISGLIGYVFSIGL